MNALPIAMKLKIIDQAKAAQMATGVDDRPTSFISKLKAEPNFKNLQSLTVYLRTKQRTWVTTFVQEGGLDILFELLANIERKLKYAIRRASERAGCFCGKCTRWRRRIYSERGAVGRFR